MGSGAHTQWAELWNRAEGEQSFCYLIKNQIRARRKRQKVLISKLREVEGNRRWGRAPRKDGEAREKVAKQNKTMRQSREGTQEGNWDGTGSGLRALGEGTGSGLGAAPRNFNSTASSESPPPPGLWKRRRAGGRQAKGVRGRSLSF